ncbi:MAG TPA: 3-dehydro-scyllo-inosose hydrolase [Anaerolineae bacterium]|nr:3-dehydro-scyllo-inosose hydrolase [Anaerolineae bacterium]HOQ97259.1 3-dehydro-scyllo-inosose hydrolase [Anaerolineae bacterium]HPL27661.1 3-dehydro-scyllo-inosose hydrolase [Anaerolineae bacterium]
MEKWQFPPDGGHMERPTGIYLQTMTTREAQERLKKNDIIILPIGSTENHGPHACSGEDTFLVSRMAELVAQKTGCTVAEPMWYGSHPFHHLGMPGTVVIPEETFIAYIRAIIAGLWNSGWRKIILLNGHGQDYAIPMAMHQFAKKYQVPALLVNVNWWFVIPEHIRDKAHGGPFETPFVHADECETSYSMALFPEMIQQEYAVDTEGQPLMPPGHIDGSGSAYGLPIPFWQHVGGSTIEVVATPEGVVGKATLADPEKARPGLNAILDYLEKLVTDIITKYPAGVLPPAGKLSQRPREEIEALLKGPLVDGGRHLYTVAYPP